MRKHAGSVITHQCVQGEKNIEPRTLENLSNDEVIKILNEEE